MADDLKKLDDEVIKRNTEVLELLNRGDKLKEEIRQNTIINDKLKADIQIEKDQYDVWKKRNDIKPT